MPLILCEHESQVAACKSFTVVFIAFAVVVTSDSTIDAFLDPFLDAFLDPFLISTLPDSHRAILLILADIVDKIFNIYAFPFLVGAFVRAQYVPDRTSTFSEILLNPRALSNFDTLSLHITVGK